MSKLRKHSKYIDTKLQLVYQIGYYMSMRVNIFVLRKLKNLIIHTNCQVFFILK